MVWKSTAFCKQHSLQAFHLRFILVNINLSCCTSCLFKSE